MISFKHSGNFDKTEKFLKGMSMLDYKRILNKYGQLGVVRLSAATPISSGITANSWGYRITTGKNYSKITWTNSNIEDGVPIAVLIQYGHSTKNGGFVMGRDFINPTMRPIADVLAEEIWTEVTNL